MPNRSPEQDLIDAFIKAVTDHSNEEFKPRVIYNQSCKAKKYADVEFETINGTHWVIEAKSHDSKDKYNTVHKIFGELLKETGKSNRNCCKFGLLLPEDALNFYSNAFRAIDRDRYLQFGKLIPISSVFLFGVSGLQALSWDSLFPLSNSATNAP